MVATGAAVTACLGIATVVAARGNHVDFDVYRAAGEVLIAGGNPYADLPNLPFTYPPFALLLCVVAAEAPALALAVLELMTVAVSGFAVIRSLGMRQVSRPALLAAAAPPLVTEPVLRSLHLGQLNGLILSLVLLDSCLMPPQWRGIATGLAAGFKLTPLIFLLVCLTRRQFAPATKMLATFGLSLAATPLMGGDARSTWSFILSPARVGSPAFVDNQSLWGLVHRVAPDQLATPLGAGLCIITLAVSLRLLVALREEPSVDAVLVCALCGLLISPISWSHHWILAFPLALSLVRKVGARAWSRAAKGIATTCLVAVGAVLVVGPHWLVERSQWHGRSLNFGEGVLASSMTISGIVLLMVAVALDPRRVAAPRARNGPYAHPGLGKHVLDWSRSRLQR